MRSSANRPTLSTRMATDTLSKESRFTAQRRGTGSCPGSRTTSLASLRMVVVHGATIARRSRGIAASRDSTTTGRRPISDNSHHHTSPRIGSGVTMRLPPSATSRDRPTHRVDQRDFRHKRHSWRRSRAPDSGRGELGGRHPPARHRSFRSADFAPLLATRRRLSYSAVCGPCHKYAIQRRPHRCRFRQAWLQKEQKGPESMVRGPSVQCVRSVVAGSRLGRRTLRACLRVCAAGLGRRRPAGSLRTAGRLGVCVLSR